MRVGGKCRSQAAAWPRQFASGRERTAPERGDQTLERHEDPLIPLPEQRGQDVLAEPLAPQVVGTVAAWQVGGIEVHPVAVLASVDPEPARADPLGAEAKAPLQAVEIDADSFDVDGGLRHVGLLLGRCPNITRNMARW